MKKDSRRMALAKATRLTSQFPMITGVDYGPATRNGEQLKTFAIRFHVNQKLPISEIKSHYILPRKIDGIRCDVLEGNYSIQSIPDYFCSDMQPGISVGSSNFGTTGTIGPIIIDNVTGRIGLLSCWHVICGSVQARPGDSVIQPGVAHAGTNAIRNTATLERFLSLNLGYDAAFALLNPGISYRTYPWGVNIAITGVEEPRGGMRVLKVGAITGTTFGVVDSYVAPGNFALSYSAFGDTNRRMTAYKIVLASDSRSEELTMEGDSGALWICRDSGKAVALNFAGEDEMGRNNEYALAHSLPQLLKLLNIRLA
ncbi:hypothetical protein ACI2KS_22785 [Pseudomonas sp. NPDC087358]|uniref:hypothetical protein n=1 Tax=Pseudomonas sp. NPDC087358 TaxID=3364439 RepID=UPI00384C2E34